MTQEDLKKAAEAGEFPEEVCKEILRTIESSEFWGRSLAKTQAKLDKALLILDLIERGRYQNGDKLSKLGMRAMACNCMEELGSEATPEQIAIGREPITSER